MKKLHYKDVVLADPVYSDIRSRDDVNTLVHFLGRDYKSCMVPANMQCTVSFDMARKLDHNGYFYILHRFYDYNDIFNWAKDAQAFCSINLSVGVKDKDKQFVERLAEEAINVDTLTIDIAYGHSILMKEMIKFIKKTMPYKTKLIAGNVCTREGVLDLIQWGADAVKVGIAGGFACRTYNTTGVGSPMFSTVLDACKVSGNVPIIADGGIRDTSDVCKALVAGATMVMAGTKFVECGDSPAPSAGDGIHKEYYGSASARNKGHNKYVEGSDRVLIKIKRDSYINYYKYVDQGIRSCMSYHNIRDIHHMKRIQWSEHNSEFLQ